MISTEIKQNEQIKDKLPSDERILGLSEKEV